MTPQQWARVLSKGAEAAEAERVAEAWQPGHMPGQLAVALAAMSREAEQIGQETR